MRVILALHLGKAEPNPVFLTKKKKKYQKVIKSAWWTHTLSLLGGH